MDKNEKIEKKTVENILGSNSVVEKILGNSSAIQQLINSTSSIRKLMQSSAYFQSPFYEYTQTLNAIRGNNHLLNQLNSQFDWIRKISEPYAQITKLYNSSFLNQLNNSSFLNYYKKYWDFSDTLQKIRENPELQYSFIVDLEILSLDTSYDLLSDNNNNELAEIIQSKNELVNSKIEDRLKDLNLIGLWQGAEFAINTDIAQNPDKIRHCAISLRTIFEYIFEKLLAPNSEIKKLALLKPEFAEVLKANKDIKPEKIEDDTKIKKPSRLKYLNYRISFGYLEEFAEKDISFVLNLYGLLSTVHEPEFQMNDNKLKILKIKTGILIWLFLDLYEILKDEPINIRR